MKFLLLEKSLKVQTSNQVRGGGKMKRDEGIRKDPFSTG